MNTAALNQDARNRALRSFLQGLGIDVATAVAAALILWLPDADLSSRDAWIVLGTGLARTLLNTVASYVMRAFLDKSGIPTPLPPAPVPAPNDTTPELADPAGVILVNGDKPIDPDEPMTIGYMGGV